MEENMNDSTAELYEITYEYGNWSGEMARCPSSELPFSHIYLPMLYFFIFFTGVSGNVFVVWVMRSKRKSRLVDTFIINLALADLVFVLTLPLWALTAAQHHHWAFGKALCKLSSYIISVNRFSNIFFLTGMSADRYLAVVRMLDSRYLRSSRCIRMTCGFVWVSSFILAVPSLVFRNTANLDKSTICYEDEESTLFQVLSLATLLLTFVLPMLIILYCYGSILVQLQRRSGVGSIHTKARCCHSVKMVFSIILAFVISWLPFNMFKSFLIVSQLWEMELSCEVQGFLARGLILSSCLAFFNSCANPAIYLLLDQHFRSRARMLCHGCVREPHGHVLSPSSFSDSTSWLSFPRSRSRAVRDTHTFTALQCFSSLLDPLEGIIKKTKTEVQGVAFSPRRLRDPTRTRCLTRLSHASLRTAETSSRAFALQGILKASDTSV
ncbi:putative G-protein coupled receptor 25 [Arapaima gigas]